MRTKLLLIATMLLSITTFAQDLAVTFANARNTNDGVDDFYEADILVASTAGFKLGDGQIYFNYNTAAFGENVVANGNFEFLIPDGAILALPGGFGLFYGTNFVDNTNAIVSTNYFAQGSAGVIDGNNINDTPTLLFSMKIKYEDVNQDAGISFNTTINGATEQFFTACGPFDTPANKDCTNFPGTQITAENAIFDSTGADINILSIGNFDDAFVDFAVYPNPVQNSFTIKSTDTKLDAIKLYNISGTLVKDISPKSINGLVDVHNLQSGVYFLQVGSGGASKTLKLVKQ